MIQKAEILPDLISGLKALPPSSPLLHHRENDVWKTFCASEVMEKVQSMALYLTHKHTIQKGERIGLLGLPSAYWVCADFAIHMCAAVVVPFFPNGSRENLKYKIYQTQMTKIFVLSNSEWLADLVNDSQIQTIFSYIPYDHSKIISTEQLYNYKDVSNNILGMKLPHTIGENDLATIIYTSGSTGKPKGVCLTHKNFISQINDAKACFPLYPAKDRSLSCLPLAHSFERMIIYYYIYSGIPIYFNNDILSLARDFKDVRPTVMTVVPRLLEKWMKKVEAKMQDRGGVLAHWFLTLKTKISREQHLTSTEKLKWLVLKLWVFPKIRSTMGGAVQCLISGGAALNPVLYRELSAIGLPVFQGYGLTECSPVLSTNYPLHHKLGSVGKPFRQVSMRISPEGEIQAKGPNVMQGYYKLKEETENMFTDDHWIKTGDKGEIDQDGFLFVKGRIKELFKTSTGEYVNPSYLEGKLNATPWIDLSLIIGENQKFVTALLFPDFKFIETWDTFLKSGTSIEEFLQSKVLSDLTFDMITQINEELESWEKIKKWYMIGKAPSIESGELTPSFKLRRNAVMETYASVILQFYK